MFSARSVVKYDHAGRTRVSIRGFIKYLLACKQSQRKNNPERWTL